MLLALICGSPRSQCVCKPVWHSVSQNADSIDKLKTDLDKHNYVADYIYGKSHGHTIGFSWKDNKIYVYIDGLLVRAL